MGSYGIPDWTREDFDVDWSSLPGEFTSPDKKKLRRITLRDASGKTREVVIEDGLNPRIIPPPGGKEPEPSDDPGVVRPPPTLESRMREQETFLDALKFGAGAILDPVGSVHGGEWARDIVEDFTGKPESAPGAAGRTVLEKGLQLASSPLTGVFAVPGVAASTFGRLAALGFGGMAAHGGGAQLGEALALTEDQGVPWSDPEVVRRLTSGGLDLAMAPLAAAGALHGEPMARANRFGAEVVEPALERVAPYVDRAARELGYQEPMAASFMAERPMKPVEPDTVEVFRSGDGSFFTTNAERAASYPGTMTKVRVPRDVFEAGRAEASKLGQPTPQDTVLPDEWVRQATEVEKPDVSIAGSELAPDERASLFAELGIEETPPAGPVEPVFPKGEAPQAAGPRTFRTPEEEGAYLMDILNSDAPASEKMMAQLRIEEITNPEIPTDAEMAQSVAELPAEVAKEAGGPQPFVEAAGHAPKLDWGAESPAKTAYEGYMKANPDSPVTFEQFWRAGGDPAKFETVRPANVIPPEGVTVQKVPASSEGNVRNLNDVIDTMYGKGARVKATQVREARGVYEELTKTAKGDTPTTAELQAVLEKRKTPVAAAPEVPPKEQAPAPEVIKEGGPSRVYHGTPYEYEGAPSVKFAERSGGEPEATYYTSKREVAEGYSKLPASENVEHTDRMTDLLDNLIKSGMSEKEARAKAGRVLEGDLKLNNPMTVDMGGKFFDPKRYGEFIKEAQAKGHDGVIVRNVGETSNRPDLTGDTYISLKDGQFVEVKPSKVPIKERPLSEMTPEEMEAEAVAAEGRMREGKPAPDYERASTLRRLAEQKRTQATRDAQIEANRQASAAATKAAVEEVKKTPLDTMKDSLARMKEKGETGPAVKELEAAITRAEVAGPVRPLSEAYPEPIGPKRPRGRPPKPENPLEAKIPKAARPERVNPVEVFTGEKPEPAPVEPLKKSPVKKAQADVDKVSQAVEKETSIPVDKAPKLNTPEGKKFVKSFAKHMGVTEDKAAAMVGGETAPKGSIPPAGPATAGPGGKIVPGAGKTVPAPPAGGPPSAQPPTAPPTPRLPRPKGKRPSFDVLEWMRRRRSGAVSQELTRRKFSNLPKGVQAQLEFESGALDLPQVRKWLDSKHRLMRKAGIDVGYVENYLTHLWKESPSEVRAKLGKRLGLKPGIAMTRSIPTLAEGIQKGLTPKFENMTDVLAWYDHATNKALADRGFFEWLREQKQIRPAGKAPHDWVTLDPDRFPIRKWKGNTVQFKAPREMATRINEYLYDIEADPRTFIQGLHKVGQFSSFLKNIRLAAGVPFTKLNMHSFSVMAHHVLSTPTIKGVVPNIPRMIGRGLKDFGEMVDPRLHRWTDAELRQAKLMQKHGPLTLSTEDHVFAPEVRGSLKERLAKAKNVPQAFKTIIDRMFEEPLFQSHLPKMKLNVAWELQRQYRREGMARRQAMEAAGEVTNNFFGGLNLDEMGRSKIGQELARVVLLAPDWLESNLRTVKEISKSPLGRTPKEKTYRDFVVNLIGTYVAGTILQRALTGKWMHENAPGNQFSIYLGKNPDNGKDRYVKPYGAGLAGVRIIYDTAESTARRQDIGRFGEILRSRLSIPTGTATSYMFNKGPFGQPITRKGDTLGGQLASVGELVAGQATPQYVLGPVAALRGEISPELGLAQAIEFPYTEVKPRNPNEAAPSKKRRRRRRR